MWFIGVKVEQETSAPRPKKDPGSAPVEGEIGLQLPSKRFPRFSGQRQRKQRQILPFSHKSKPNGNNISLICCFERDQCSIELNRAQRKGSLTGHYSHTLNSQNPARKFGTCAITRLGFLGHFIFN